MRKTVNFIGLFTISFLLIYSCKVDNKNVNESSSTNENVASNMTIEEKVELPIDFTKVYTVQKVEDLGYAGINRRQIRITVPSGLDKIAVENNLKHAVIEYYKMYNPDGLSIVAYENGDNVESAFTVGMAVFAPDGLWENIESNKPLENFELNIELKEAYFQPKEKQIEIGSTVTLFKETEWSKTERKSVPAKSVPISNSAREWTAENIIVKIPNNTKGTILEIHKEKLVDGSEFIRYKVEVSYNGKKYQGWINSEEIKK